MPENDWGSVVGAVTEEVLETMFFTCVCGPAEPGALAGEPRLTAHLTFQGSPCGAFTLSLAEPAARTLAANFVAHETEDAPPAPEVGAVVCELANMICGAVLSRVESDSHFRLSSPELLPEASALPSAPPDQSLDLGDGVLEVWLSVEDHAG